MTSSSSNNGVAHHVIIISAILLLSSSPCMLILIPPLVQQQQLMIPAYAQQPPAYVNYLNAPNNHYVWLLPPTNELVAYRKDASVGLVKEYGPSSFQTITKSYLLANTPPQTDLVPLDQAQWANDWAAIVDDLDRWVFIDKYAMYPFLARYQKSGDNYDSLFHYLIKVDLTTQEITLNRVCSYCNTTGFSGSIIEVIQLANSAVVVYKLIDTAASPDDIYLYMEKIDANSANNYHISNANSIAYGVSSLTASVKAKTRHEILLEVTYNVCTIVVKYSYKVFNSNKTLLYQSEGNCNESGQPEPTLASITQLGMSGSSIFVSQTLNNQTYYYKCELVNANDVINSFNNCIDVDSNDAFSNNILVSNPTLRTDQALAQNLPYPSLLFKNGSTFYKSKWFLPIDNTKIYAQGPNTILSTNTNYVIRNLFAERPGTITNDANALGGVWKLRVEDSTDPNNIQTAEYNISNMFYSNTLELQTLLTYFNPANSDTINVFLVWQINYNGELKERVFNLKFIKEANVGMASIDLSDPSVAFAEVTVVFTNPQLANTDMFIKLQGRDVFVDLKRTAPDRIKFFTIEGNCYQIYKRNQAYTWLGNLCSVPPFNFTIGPSEGQEGNILIGIYWFPQWYVTHIYYQDSNNVDVIIHKTPPFTYRIKILNYNDNTVYADTGWQTGNNDPLTRTFTLGNDDKYKLVVYGRDNNIERTVYTADLIKKQSLQFFLPFQAHGVNVMLLIVIASMLMWTKNNVAVGTVATVGIIGLLNWLGLLEINDNLFMLLLVLAGIGLIISKRMFG